MIAEECHPSRAPTNRVRPSRAPRLPGLGLAAALGLAPAGALAFPLISPSDTDLVPQGTELLTPDAHDLQHQLQIVNGMASPTGGGWTFIPRIDDQEMLTDNVQELHSPRQTDFVTYLSPGFNLVGSMPRINASLSFAPTLALYAEDSSLNALTQQFNGLASITLAPDWAFVDIRALAGVQSLYGGLGGLGSLGSTSNATAQGAVPTLAGNSQGLTKANETQTVSFGVSPYATSQFGDWGNGRIGDSINVTRSAALSGFIAPPYPTGGLDGQTLISNEETARFTSGDILQWIQDVFTVDLQQTQTTSDPGSINANTNTAFTAATHTSSSREVVSDQITYALNRTISVFASGGHEDIVYSGVGGESINDLTWSLGTTITPNPNSQLSVSYGHQNGTNTVTANGYYALTARTTVNLSYTTLLGTQLENLQNQLQLASVGPNGTLVNGQNGGQLFGANNALALQEGVFLTKTLTIGTQTTLDRDIITLNLLMSTQTTSGGSASSSSSAKTFQATWVHQMQPDMTLNGSLSYSIQDQGAQTTSASNPGNSTSIVASLGWQFQISSTISSSLRYSFFQRQSAVTLYNIYQNMLILGISKTF